MTEKYADICAKNFLMLIKRALYDVVWQRLAPGKAVILLGPRQAGKSTILNEVGLASRLKVLRLDCDDAASKASVFQITCSSIALPGKSSLPS
jgi:Uncharacterized protein conserved in bacteria